MSLYLGENLISGSKPINLGVRNIGEIVPSILPLTDAGLHLLDGSLILGGGIYQGFVDYIAELYGDGTNIPSYFCTESEWQTSVTTYGVCGKFVYDSTNNTVRLPKVTGIIEGTTDVTALGDLIEAGLPNITGKLKIGVRSYLHPDTSATGAFELSSTVNGYTGNNSEAGYPLLSFDASNSNSIYGNSNTVQPQTIKCFYYIVIATSTKTDIQVDIDEVTTDLNGKADTDLSNINASQSAKNEIISWGMPDYSAGIGIITGAASQLNYTAPSDGVIYGSLQTVNAAGTNGILYVNNNIVASTISYSGSPYCPAAALVNKGDVITTNCYIYQVYFYPLKGAN